MPSEEHYNDTESNYYILFLIAIIAIPSTYLFVKRKFLLLVALWSFFFVLATNVQSTTVEEPQELFDPYQILGLDYSATPDQIKKAYRQLGLIHHPDKANDSSKYISIVKAYDTLTDELARSNWEKYGNPDGRQAYSIGIALPSWLVKKDNTFIVLGVYIALLIIGLPAVVCCWWRSWKKYDSTKVMNSSMSLYYHKIEQLARVKVISELISVSQEYQTVPIRNSDEQQLLRLAKMVPEAHAMKKKPKYNVPYAIKINALFYAQMSRLQAHLSPGLKSDLQAALLQARPLLAGFITISTAKGLLVPILETLLFLQMLTQSTWNKEDLLQLPHFTHDIVDIFNSKKKNCGELSRFIAISVEKRKGLLIEEGLNQTQISDIEKVLQYLPTNVNITFNCQVEGEDGNKIVAKSVVTCFFKIFRGEDNDEEDDESDFDSSASEDEKKPNKKIDEEKEKKRKVRKLKQHEKQQKWKKEAKEGEVKRMVHAPYFPEKREECWWVIIGDSSSYTLVGVHKAGGFGRKIEGKIKFLAPPKPGTYSYTIYLVCDGYLGCDKQKTLKIHVVHDDNPPKVEVATGKKVSHKMNGIHEHTKEGSDFSDEDLLDSDSSGSDSEN